MSEEGEKKKAEVLPRIEVTVVGNEIEWKFEGLRDAFHALQVLNALMAAIQQRIAMETARKITLPGMIPTKNFNPIKSN